jgi:hypothetical protein
VGHEAIGAAADEIVTSGFSEGFARERPLRFVPPENERFQHALFA